MMRLKTFKFFLIILFFITSCIIVKSYSLSEKSGESRLIIHGIDKDYNFTTSELLKRNDITKITIYDDPAYGSIKMEYLAVPLNHLFATMTLPQDASLEFYCQDGFSAPISMRQIMNQSNEKSVAYLAIEPESKKWPILSSIKSSKTAGPFYLIWKNPELSQISKEEWPFQLVGFRLKPSISTLYPKILPSTRLNNDNRITKGFNIFKRNCFVCHTLNLQGSSKVGPDLNIPMNPTEYFNLSALKTLIRNPQKLRHWPQSKMPGFTQSSISDTDLNNLILYLKHMAARKVN